MLVLIVEDSPTCSAHLAARLRAAPHHADVTIVASVDEAIRWLATNRPDFVVLDLHLPDGNGLDVIPAAGNACAVAVTGDPESVPEGVAVVRKGPRWAAHVETLLESRKESCK